MSSVEVKREEKVRSAELLPLHHMSRTSLVRFLLSYPRFVIIL